MDDTAAVEERIVTERIRQKLNEVNTAAQTQLSGVQDHVHFTLQVSTISSKLCVPTNGVYRNFFVSWKKLQQAYFRCAYECFDRRKKQEEIDNCVEYCSVPVLKAQNFIESEMANFQVKKLFFFFFIKKVSYMFGSSSNFEILCTLKS